MDETFQKVAELLQNNKLLTSEEIEQLDLLLFSCIVYRNALQQLVGNVTDNEESGDKLFTNLVDMHINGVENGYEYCDECGSICCSGDEDDDEPNDDDEEFISNSQKEYLN